MEEFQARIKATMDVSDVVSNVGTIQKTLSKLKLPDRIGENLNKNISSFYKEYEKYQKKVADGIKTQGDYNQVEKSLNRLKALYKDIDKDLSKTTKLKAEDIIDIGKGDFKRIADEISSVIKSINNVKIDTRGIEKFTNEIESLTKSKTVTGDNGILNRMIGHLEVGNITEAKKELIELQKYADKVATRKVGEGKDAKLVRGTMGEEKYRQLQSAISAISAAFDKADADAAPFIQRLNELQSEMAQTKQLATKDFLGNANKFKDEAKNVEKVTDSLKRLHQEEYSFNRQAQDIDRQIQTYFGLSQMIRKVGDIARDAFNTVKELDAAMVETAVVTNFSVGDMWEMLPTYTKNANQLGSTIKDVYEAATLYYQQGLNQVQSMGLANETLKMARIGGLEAADATNMMTAALRGFNMELNQTSAQRINDVYSELAAITAADTKEIGSAMERTASIADSANMEFETTSAFLAQMIETTREAPENLGTAMKTIIARFQEMKQDPTKLVDSEGVAMDANRVDTALKTIGVNLTNTKGEFRDLDDVFLEISEKWDSLTQGQQRYIATIAAGARQQSRFIAMMQNYERVKELVDAANNSAGASQKQFEKTLTSMSAKLNRLKNAWDQFTMGLLNNKILKGAVDGLTGVFTVVNKIINALGSIPPSPFEGITKSALTLVSTLGMLQFGKKAARGAIFAGAGWWKNEGKITENFKEGWGPRVERNKRDDRDLNTKVEEQLKQKVLSRSKKSLEVTTGIRVKAVLESIDTTTLGPKLKEDLKNKVEALSKEIQSGNITTVEAKVQLKDYAMEKGLHNNTAEKLAAGFDKQSKISVQAGKVEALSNKFNTLGSNIANAGMSLTEFGNTLGGPVGSALSTVGSVMTSFGTTIQSIGIALLDNYKAALLSAEGNVVNATSTTALSTAQAGAATTARALGVALWSTLGPLVAIAAAIGVAIGAYKLLDAAIVTNKEQLEATNDAAAKASEAFDLANQELSELRDSISSVRENEAAFDNLVVGTAAFNEQLVLANQQITDLISKYPMLMDEGYVTTDKNGLMHISEQGLQAVEEYQKNIQARASAINIIQSADLAALEKEQKAQQLYRDWGDSDEDHKKNIEKANLLREQADAEKEVARQNAINATLAGTEVKNVETLSAVYAGLYEEKRKAAEQEVESLDKNSIRQKYADYYGYKYDKSTQKIKDVEGNEIEYDDNLLKDAVIEETVFLNFEENAGSLEKVLGDLDLAFNKTLGDSFKNVEGADTFISDLLGNNIETNEDLLREALSNNAVNFQNLVNSLSKEQIAAIWDISAESVTQADYTKVTNLLTENAKNLVETQAKSYEDLGVMLAKTNGLDVVAAEQAKNQKQIVSDIEALTSQQAHMMSNIGSQLEKSAGTDTMENYIGYMRDLYKQVNQSQFGNINLDTREKLFNEDGSISTVLGSWGEYGEKSIPIAFSPMLQTGTGSPEKLNQATIDKYLDKVVTESKGDKKKILELDAEGIDVDGKHIQGLIADVGSTAEETSTKMHEIEVDKEAAAEIEQIFSGADLSSASGRLKAYTDLTKSSLDTTRQLGENLMNLPESANLLGEAFDDFLGGEFTELEDNIDNFKNSMGEFDNNGILEMAKSSKTLQTLLDSGQVSATGLAKALQGVSDGSISQVNSTVLQLLSSLNRLNDSAAEAHNIIQNFDAGIDTGEGEEFVTENAKKVQEYIDNNEWGNEQLQNYIKLAAGEERWNDALRKNHGDLRKTTKALDQYATAFKDGMGPVWNQLAEEKALNGKSFEDNLANIDDEELRKKFGQVKMDFDDEGLLQFDFGELTTEEFEQYLQKVGGLSEDYAKLMMQNLANFNETEGAELAKNDLKAAVGTSEFKEGHTDLKGNIVLSDADLNAFKDAGGDIAELNQAIKGTVKTFNVLKDGERRTDTPDLLRDYAEVFKTGKHTINSLFKDASLKNEQGQFDLQKLMTDTQARAGFDQEQAMKSAYDAYVAAQKKGEETAYDGVTLDDNIKSLEEFQTAISEITEGKQWRSVGESIAQGIISYLNKGPEDKTNKKKEEEPERKPTEPKQEEKPKAQESTSETGRGRRDKGEYDTGKPNTTNQPGFFESVGNFFNSLKEGAKGYNDWIAEGKKTTKENRSGSTQTSDTTSPSMGELTAQSHLQEILKTQFSSLFSSLSPDSFSTPEMQSALNSVYKAALTPKTDTLTQGLLADFQTLGIDVNEAIKAGLVVDKNGILSKATETGKEGANATEEGLASGAESTDGSKAKEGGKKGGEKVAQETEKGAAEGASKGTSKSPTTTKTGTGLLGKEAVNIEAIANIKSVTPPKEKPEISVKAKIETKGDEKGGLLSKIKGLFGKGENGPSIKVTAEATKVTVPKESKTSVKVVGDVTKLNNQAGKLKGVKATATVNKVVKSGKVSGEPVSIKAKASVSADTGKVEKKVSKVTSSASKTQKMTIDANNGPAMNKVNQVINRIRSSKPTLNYSVSGPSSITVPVYASFKGSWTKTVKINKAAKGLNNRIIPQSIPQIGSMASGRYGRLGPKGKGGLTLTGEKGFEIAWLPSESRSMILGANGPQMVDLPKDAVVWTNEQSKKILKQKAIPAGSHSGITKTSSKNTQQKKKRGGSNGGGGGGGRGGRGNDSSSSGNNKTIKKILQKAGKINLWWWNMTKKVEATQRKIDKLNKKTEKLLKQIGSTLGSIGKTVGQYITKLNKQISLNTTMRDTANRKLTTLNNGTKYTKKASKANKKYSEATERRRTAERQVKKASKTKSKKDDREAKKELKRAQKAEERARKKANSANKKARKKGGVNYSTISYEVTKKTKKKGEKKWKKEKKTKKAKINLAPYITYDPSTGAYQIDYNKINKKFGKNKSKAKAVGEAAQKKLEDYQGKKNTAEDNITKAQEALEQLGQQLYDTFFGWELELTKIWNITQKIEQTTAEIGRLTGYVSLMDAQIAAYRGKNDEELFFKRNEAGEKQLSDFMTDYINTFAAKVQASVQKIKQQFESIDASKTELASLVDPNAKQGAIDKYSEKLNATKEGREEKEESKKTYNKDKKNAKKKKKQENQARKKMRAARKKANKKGASKKDKKAYKDAQKEYQEAKAKTKTANTKRNKSQKKYETAKNDYNTKVQEGTYYNKTDAVAYEAYLKELQDEQKIRNEARKYTNIIQNADGTISIDFDTDKFVEDRDNGKINGETAGRIQKYVQDLADQTNDLNQKYTDAEELLQEQYEALSELSDEWAGIGEELLTYYEEEQSKKIDQLKTLSDSIRDALKDLLDEVKTSLEQRRQAEDNAKTEKDISKKQQQLAALRANTAGGNQVEIAQLEKEIADAQQDYQRTLEDQLLEKLNSQAEVAEKQRAEMIELQQAVLEATNNAAEVNKWMNEPEKYQDEIRKAFYDSKDYDNLTKAQQDQLDEEFRSLYSKMLTYKDRKKILEEGVDNTKNELASIKESINTLIDKIKIETQQPKQEENKDDGDDDGGGSNGPTEEQKEAYRTELDTINKNDKITYDEFVSLRDKGKDIGKESGRVIQDVANEIGWEKVLKALKGQYNKYRLAATFTSERFKSAYDKAYGGAYATNRAKALADPTKYPPYIVNKYAGGGLATKTGPAWLDGTPSKPELVLNAQDTKNFMALRDILGSIMSSTSSINNFASTAMYEININVDHINNDYDVDKIAARVKKDIVKGAGYRNVTQVRNLR